jgi:hypothetical protein
MYPVIVFVIAFMMMMMMMISLGTYLKQTKKKVGVTHYPTTKQHNTINGYRK